MTLDAGGTQFVFSAIQAQKEIIRPIVYPAEIHSLDSCLQLLYAGFGQVMKQLPRKPVAVSFAFPGPADYEQGIIGDLPNLPCFRGGIPLGPLLRHHFRLPVFINNDGNLFAYGEAIGGLLPRVNEMLAQTGKSKRYRHLFGITLGTGIGAGLVIHQKMHRGDNSAAAEVWTMTDHLNPETFIEEEAGIRGIRRHYARLAGLSSDEAPMPKELFEIAGGGKAGDREAALRTFHDLGRRVGSLLADAAAMVDGLMVIGGGVTGAHAFFMPALIEEMNRPLYGYEGRSIARIFRAYNLENPGQREAFLNTAVQKIDVPGCAKPLDYHPIKSIGVGLSVLGTSRAASVGAYAFALDQLDR